MRGLVLLGGREFARDFADFLLHPMEEGGVSAPRGEVVVHTLIIKLSATPIPKSNQKELCLNSKILLKLTLFRGWDQMLLRLMDFDVLFSALIIFYTSSMLSIPLKRKRSTSQLPYEGQQTIAPSLPRLQLLSNLEAELVSIIGRKNIDIDDSADLFSRLEEIYMSNLQGAAIGREMLERVLRVLGEIDSPARVKFLFLYAHELAITQQQSSAVCSNLLESFHCNLSLKEKLEVGFKAGLIYCQLCHQGADVDRLLSNLIVSLEHQLGYRPHQIKARVAANSDSTKAIYLGSRLSHKMGNKEGGKLQKLGLFKYLFEALATGEMRVRSDAKRRFYAQAKDQLRQRLGREYPGRQIQKKLRTIEEGNWVSKIFIGYIKEEKQQKQYKQERIHYQRQSESKALPRSRSQAGLGSKDASRRSSPVKGQFSSTAPNWVLPNKSSSSNFKLIIKKRSGSKQRNPSEQSSVEASERPKPEIAQLIFKEQPQNITKGIVLKFNKLNEHKQEVKKKAKHIPFLREKAKQNQVHQVFNICLPSLQQEKNEESRLQPERSSVGELTSAGRIQIDQLIKEGVEYMSGLEKEQENKNQTHNHLSIREHIQPSITQQQYMKGIVEQEVRRAFSQHEQGIICNIASLSAAQATDGTIKEKPKENHKKTVVIALQQIQEDTFQQKSSEKLQEYGPSQCYSIVEEDLQSIPLSNTDRNDESRLKSFQIVQKENEEKGTSRSKLDLVQQPEVIIEKQQQSPERPLKTVLQQQQLSFQNAEDLGDMAITNDWINSVADDISMCAAQEDNASAQHSLYSQLVENYMMQLFDEIEREVEIKELIKNAELFSEIPEEPVEKQSESVTNIPRSNSIDDSDLDSQIKSCAEQSYLPSGFASSHKRKSQNTNAIAQLALPKGSEDEKRERDGSYFKFAGSHIEVERSNSQWTSQALIINELLQNDKVIQQNLFGSQPSDNNRKQTIISMLPEQSRQKQEEFRTLRSRSQSQISLSNAKQSPTHRSLKKEKNNLCLSIRFNDSYDAVTHSSKQFTHWLFPEIRVEKDKLSFSIVYEGATHVREAMVPFFVAINDDTVRQISANVQKFLALFPTQQQGLWEQLVSEASKIELLPEETQIQPIKVQQTVELTIRCIVNLKKSKITFESDRSELSLLPLIALQREDLSSEVSLLRERNLKIVENELRIPGVWRLLGERFIKLREKYETSVNHLCFQVCQKQSQQNIFDYFIRESNGASFTIDRVQEKERKKIWRNIDTIIGFCLKVSKEGIRLETGNLQQFLRIL